MASVTAPFKIIRKRKIQVSVVVFDYSEGDSLSAIVVLGFGEGMIKSGYTDSLGVTIIEYDYTKIVTFSGNDYLITTFPKSTLSAVLASWLRKRRGLAVMPPFL